MDPASMPLVLIAALVVLAGALGVGTVVLVRLGVFTRYALKEDRPEAGDYDLDQSRQTGDE